MKRYLLFLLGLAPLLVCAQTTVDSVSESEIGRTLQFLSSDSLGGRVNYTNQQLTAAEWLAGELQSYGIIPFPGGLGYFHPFTSSPVKDRHKRKLIWNGRKLEDSSFRLLGHHLLSPPATLDSFLVLEVHTPLPDSLLFYNWNSPEKILLWIHTATPGLLQEYTGNLVLPEGLPLSDIVLVADTAAPQSLQLTGTDQAPQNLLYNVVGILPGKTKPDEAILFSAHYDHINDGAGKTGDKIYNGANDNASGTTAVLALARYYALRRDNDRTLVFCLFAGEELGLFGSSAFASTLIPDHIVANINLEMLGYTNLSGKNAFYVTGSWYSDLTQILKKNLKGSSIKVIASTADVMQEFERSDNYSFAKLGVPAHTLTCSDDNDPCYHKPCDEFKRMDIPNLTRVVKGIIQACRTLVNGKDTPMRIRL